MTGQVALRAAAPAWAALLGHELSGSHWIAAPPLPSGSPVPATILTVASDDGYLSVSERDPGLRLPKSCPELHIVSDSSFCIGPRVYTADSKIGAEAFWQDLGQFLVNLHYAVRRGRWPVGRWLSHGTQAAGLQVEAEEIAASSGISSDYSACLENDEGWIADAVCSKEIKVPKSAVCGICRRDGHEGPTRLESCGHLAVVRRLVQTERARRSAQLSFYAMLQRGGMKCCGRMPDCPLLERIAT